MSIVLSKGTEDQVGRLAELRGIELKEYHPALDEATRRGLLRFCTYQEKECWAVTDSTHTCTQVRALDGSKLHVPDGQVKAKTLRGSKHGWPIGANLAEHVEYIALVEGGPDLLAAHAIAWGECPIQRMVVVGMMGASAEIMDVGLACLADKRVRIFPHNDEAGRAASIKWAKQLMAVGCTVDRYELTGLKRKDGSDVSDLNDLLADLHEDSYNDIEESLFSFVGK